MLSLVFWSLIIVVSLKYVTFVMRADNKGEGGIMALMALAQRSMSGSARARWVLAGIGIFGASLFYGDGVITPAISVLGAVEGIEVAAPGLGKYVVLDRAGDPAGHVRRAAPRHAQGRQGVSRR